MFRIHRTFRDGALSTVLGMLVTLPALADDIEIYQSQADATAAQPNVLFIMDTSGSMDTMVEAYNPARTYSGPCVSTRIYYTQGRELNDTPVCGGADYILATQNKCAASLTALAGVGGSYSSGDNGARIAMFRTGVGNEDNKNTPQWRSLRSGVDAPVECRADDGVHGVSPESSLKYIRNGDGLDKAWGDRDRDLWDDLDSRYRLWSANYLNYLSGGDVKTRLGVVRDVAIDLTKRLKNVNLGLMRYNDNAQGGYVISPVKDINDAVNRQQLLNVLQDFDDFDGNGFTPLSETFYEASLYLQGRAPVYGSGESVSPGPEAINLIADGKYISPIQFSCQKNYIVYLTDGAPTRDDSANDAIDDLIDEQVADASCEVGVDPYHDNGYTEDSGICMDELAAWMRGIPDDEDNSADLRPVDAVPNKQHANTYMIGFGDSIGTSKAYLDAIAAAGGTERSYTATDAGTLTTTLEDIFRDLQEDSATFVTPSIAVNAFNRAQTDNDLFFSLFRVSKTEHWSGNLKKYRLAPVDGVQTVVDSKNKPAVSPVTGFFADGSQSFWSATADENFVDKGGAASVLPAPGARKIYTTVAGALVELNDQTVSDATMGIGAGTTCGDTCKAAIGWARGVKLDPTNLNKLLDGQVDKFMGDQIHGKPAVVTYGKTTGDSPVSDTVVFVPTNDGFLHAISGIDGVELWAFIPPELLPRLVALRAAAKGERAPHSYGLDGDVRVLKLDVDRDGTVDTATGDRDRVWLFFGMRAGGNHYYSLDVTKKDAPTVKWNIGPDQLPGVGQTWSPPVIARVNVKAGGSTPGNSDPEKFVLIFGGGYDPGQETQSYSTDDIGNRIYMVEAATGTLLWWAGGPSALPGTPNLAFTGEDAGKQMNNSIPARVTVIDTNGDGFADRMYAGDMGGRLWRFDIFNGKDAGSLVTGGVWAQLGAAGLASPVDDADNRRFYNAPDVALVQFRGIDPYYNVAIGSGYRGHPLDKKTTERFYSLRDKQPFAQLNQISYNNLTPIKDGGPTDITADPLNSTVTSEAVGWAYTFNERPGEKVLADATTVANVVLFPTFQPLSNAGRGPCFPVTQNRVYAMSAFSGKPVLDFNEDFNDKGELTGEIDNDDLFTESNQGGIGGEVNVALLRMNNENPPKSMCLFGMEVLRKCVNAFGTVRTFWDRSDAE